MPFISHNQLRYLAQKSDVLQSSKDVASYIGRSRGSQRSLLAPIHKLPDELLSEIFRRVLCGKSIDIGVKRGKYGIYSGFKTGGEEIYENIAFYLSDVCQSEATRRIQLCLKLSVKALESIANHSNRLVHLTANMDDLTKAAGTNTVEALIRERGFGRLRTLELIGHMKSYSFPSHLFRTATELEIIKLNNIYPKDDFELPWGKVNKFELSTFDNIQWRSILSNMPYIEEFTAEFCRMNQNVRLMSIMEDDKSNIHDVLTLSSLHTMNIHNPEISSLWSTIQVPNLVNLEILTQNDHDIDDFLHMFKASGRTPGHEELTLCYRSASLPDFSDIRAEETLVHLIWDPSVCELLPSLRTLRITSEVEDELPPIKRILGEIMQSRSSGRHEASPAPLEILECTWDVPKSMYSKFKSSFNEVNNWGSELGVAVDFNLVEVEDPHDDDDDDDDGRRRKARARGDYKLK
ncbi:hypothetical protein BDQ17DRAFT_1424881 [Cyathus striatus]|nr:hypothetical protein BDQ17DRAFT_1424881 [Cyathus striatus]